MLIHVDRVEDWTPPSPCSSHSGQSGLPSSDSDNDDRPFLEVLSGTWTMEVEDGCRGMPRGGHERDRDEDDGAGRGGRRSWKNALLRCGRTPAPQPPAPAPHQRSRSPPARRHSRGARTHRHDEKKSAAAAGHRRSTPLPPPQVGGDDAAVSNRGKDPVDEFFKAAKRPTVASMIVDNMAADVQAAADAMVAAPLVFDNTQQRDAAPLDPQLDAFCPTLAATPSANGQFNRSTPTAACTLEVQLGTVTSRVCQLEIAEEGDQAQSGRLFRSNTPPLVATSPTRRSSAPPKDARQAANPSTVSVAQRASLRIVKELGLLGPKEKMTTEVAEALLRWFDEPLSEVDIAVIAKLTHLYADALKIAAGMAGPDGAAEEAVV
ncbi:hypothetical protein VPH35_065350 [Triticum aestivum]